MVALHPTYISKVVTSPLPAQAQTPNSSTFMYHLYSQHDASARYKTVRHASIATQGISIRSNMEKANKLVLEDLVKVR